MGFKPNYRKKFNISNCLETQIQEAFEKPITISGQFLGIRNIHHGSFNKRTVIFTSYKNGGAFSLESRLELAHALDLERDISVLKYRTQAIKVTLSKAIYAIPDFLILNNLHNYEVHEVKSNLKSLSKEKIEKLEITKQVLKSYNINYKIFDEITLPSNKEVNSTLRIYKNIKNINIDKDKINQAQILTKDINKDFSSLLGHLSKHKYSYNEICYLVFYKHIPANINI
ncbi:TnsA endonuclease N-terminal domain-containing protein [Acinetobacter sp. WU_MDCI_Abxc22]|uniref:TnsA endonuclease N-terminal domain-containing protein n=1 Tax=Acinetobacter sp. WU_MDCI_Abxc22 TaxID=2850071 RepID=UPI0021CDA56A|nr:TnsA endonuclease N-terminal domain-containing protein [Acinetobacter sp. WU_MDCI_Abxc22]MCU4361689.1 TnsA endonuclease N-terminal domain-containing protein [Acinetobacter sp. WU_MDCI_Abxc22]